MFPPGAAVKGKESKTGDERGYGEYIGRGKCVGWGMGKRGTSNSGMLGKRALRHKARDTLTILRF